MRSTFVIPCKTFMDKNSCQLCVITLHCTCSLSSAHYILPVAYRQRCDPHVSPIEYKHVTNTFAMYTFFNESMKQQMRSYKNTLDEISREITIPQVTFHAVNNFSSYVRKSQYLTSKYKHVLELQKQNISFFKTKDDKLIYVARNMSDVISSKSMNLIKPLKYVIRWFLGNGLWSLSLFVSLSLFLGVFAFVWACIQFYPTLRKQLSRKIREQKANRMYSLLLLQETEM